MATNLGYLIKSGREAAGVTQEELAEKIGATQQSVSRWESNKVMPPISRLTKIAPIIGVELNELLAGAAYNAVNLKPVEDTSPSRLETVEQEVAEMKEMLGEILSRLPASGGAALKPARGQVRRRKASS